MNKLQETSLRHCSIDELQSLIDNGVFTYHQCTIEKMPEASYRLYWYGFGDTGPQVLDIAPTLQGIIDATKKRKMDIKYYRWQRHAEENNEETE
jgi:hypothetical protein